MFVALTLGGLGAGCGTAVAPEFENCITNQNGDCILFDDVEAVLEDDELSEDEKREALRELGLEDEELIDALLNE